MRCLSQKKTPSETEGVKKEDESSRKRECPKRCVYEDGAEVNINKKNRSRDSASIQMMLHRP
jgi:hypothetical protein